MNAVLEIIKKNMLSLICGLIAILAIVAVEVWPLPGYFVTLQKNLDKRKADLQNYEALATKQRTLPLLDPNETEAKPLPGFPTDDMIERGNAIKADIAAEAKSVEDLSLKLNEHAPLLPGSLPAPSRTVAFSYEEAYQKMVDFSNSDPIIRTETLPIKVLHAGMEPTTEEISAEKARRKKEIIDTLLVPGQNDTEVAAKVAAMEQSVQEDMKRDIALKAQMYMSRDALSIVPNILEAKNPPPPEVIWNSQLSLWVQQDVCTAIANANKGSSSVNDSAVKHLLKIDVSPTLGAPVASAAQPQGEGSTPTVQMKLSGRSSNSNYEVIPYRLVINVDARKVPQVLSELAKNRFTTITQCNLSSVDVGAQAVAGYYYGPRPVVQLQLNCETIYLKSWMSKYAPASAAAAQPQG